MRSNEFWSCSSFFFIIVDFRVSTLFKKRHYSAGWSVGPSVDKQYAYRFAEDSTYAVNWELNDLIEPVRNDPDAPGGMASRHIKGDWYIELWYDK